MLRAKGYFTEALSLEAGDFSGFSGDFVTVLDEEYPSRWLSVLGDSAPPVLWASFRRRGFFGPLLGMVGSRAVSREVRGFCTGVAQEAAGLGYSVISGGAYGCDQAAVEGASKSIVVLPYGISLLESGEADLYLSLCSPDEPFSRGRAMERNALIYAAGSHCFVGHARFRSGGTWTGATDALRRRLTRVVIREDRENPGHRALASLGALELKSPQGLAEALATPDVQGSLFGALLRAG